MVEFINTGQTLAIVIPAVRGTLTFVHMVLHVHDNI